MFDWNVHQLMAESDINSRNCIKICPMNFNCSFTFEKIKCDIFKMQIHIITTAIPNSTLYSFFSWSQWYLWTMPKHYQQNFFFSRICLPYVRVLFFFSSYCKQPIQNVLSIWRGCVFTRSKQRILGKKKYYFTIRPYECVNESRVSATSRNTHSSIHGRKKVKYTHDWARAGERYCISTKFGGSSIHWRTPII